ncbi:MAG: hypothetical protein IJR45_04810 [Firmicutes bacterium]|nr:hypothetical protein [Bacillota bacterium]MBQ9604718.1 hypothetical protein [Bacillota bacterium]
MKLSDKEIKHLLKGLDEYIAQNYIGEVRREKRFLNAAPLFAKAAQETGSADAACEPMCMQDLEAAVKNVGETFSQRLLRFIDESGKAPAEIYKKANIDRKLFSKIQCDSNYQPKKKTAVAFALALELGLDDTKDLLKSAGYALSPASVSDLIIEYFIKNGVYDIFTINDALDAHDRPIIG